MTAVVIASNYSRNLLYYLRRQTAPVAMFDAIKQPQTIILDPFRANSVAKRRCVCNGQGCVTRNTKRRI